MECAMRRLICVLSALGAACVLSACGVRGDLERPPPLWGEDLRSPAERAYEDDGDTSGDDTPAEEDPPAEETEDDAPRTAKLAEL
jgi:predicted small lipoprotein YifL